MTGKRLLYTVIGSFLLGFLFFHFVFPLFVSYGKVTKVPELKNTELKRAIKILQSMELKGVVVDSVYSNVVKRGRVVETIPPSGKKIRFGRRVKLIVSRGGERVPFPDVKGKPVEEARKLLMGRGINNIIVINVPVPPKEAQNFKEGYVVDVSPDTIDSIEKSAKVTLYVAKIQEEVFLMPNLVGMHIWEAKKTIEKYKLVLGTVKSVSPGDSFVILQNPLPGIEVVYGETVSVVLGKKK